MGTIISAFWICTELTERDLGDGVSFAASPAETAVQENSKQERRRCEIIKELIETEKTYLNHLDIIHKVGLIANQKYRYDIFSLSQSSN